MADAKTGADWMALYSDRALRSLGIPGFARHDPAEGLFRHLLLTLDELPVGRKGDKAAPFDVICCDVLWIGGEVTLTRDTHIFARRIEVSAKARLELDRTDGDFGLWLVAQEITDRATGAAANLPLRVFSLDAKGEPQVADAAISAARDVPAVAAALPPGATAPEAAHPEDLAGIFMRRGEELPLCLNTQFIFAALLFTSHPKLAAQILAWITALVQASEDFADLSVEARSLRETITSLARNTSATLVPTLDHSVYAEAAQQCLALLQQRQERYQQLMTISKADRNWQRDAETALADRQNEADLYASLEKQAEASREQAEQARWLATVRVRDDHIELGKKQHAFETGILDWKRKQTQAAIIDIVTNAVKLLMELPALVAAAPAAAGAATDLIGGAVDIASSIAKGDFDPMPSKLRSWTSKATENAKKQGALEDWSKGGGKGKAEAIPIDPLPNEKDEQDPPRRPRKNQPKGDDDDLVLLVDEDSSEESDAEAPQNGPVQPPKVADLIDEFIMVDEDPEAKKWAKQALAREKEAKAAKKERDKKAASFVKAFKGAAGSTKAIVQSAMRINQIAETAEMMENNSAELLSEIAAGLKIALGGIDLKGLGTVTGGSEEWDKMSLSIEEMFELLADGELMGVAGARPYRETYRTLMIDGKALCQARLALAKANSDLAAAKIRRTAADRAVALFKTRARELAEEVLRDELYQQAAFQRVVEAKRGVFLALESYRRAFAYFTLQPEGDLPALPRITDTVDAMSRVVRDIAGRKLASETISNLYGPPSTLNGVELVLDDPETLAAFRSKDGVVTLSIPVTAPGFAAFRRVRLGGLRVYLDGIPQGAKPTIRIESNGVYHDKRQSKPDAKGASQSYVTRPERKIFVYQQGRDTPIADADIADRYANDFFRPTPFTTWRFQLARDAGPVPDLDGLSAIRVQFFGEYSP